MLKYWNLRKSVKCLRDLRSMYILLAIFWIGISMIYDPKSISNTKKSCMVTDHVPLFVTAFTSIFFGFILYLPHAYDYSILTRPTDVNPHPQISKGVCIVAATYSVGVFIFGAIIIACCLLGFQIEVGKIGCLSTVVQVILFGLPAVFGLTVICLLYLVYRELLVCVTPLASAGSPAEQTTAPKTEELTTMAATTPSIILPVMTTSVRRDAPDTMDITEDAEDIV